MLYKVFIAFVICMAAKTATAEHLIPKRSKVMHVKNWHMDKPGYLGVQLRPMFCTTGCAKSCDGSVISFGIDAGYGYWGFGFRYAYKGKSHYLIPDLRGMYPIHLGRRFFIEPLLEISPIFWTNGQGRSLQLTLRPGLRIRFQFNSAFGVYLEPVLLDFVVHAWTWGTTPTGMGSFIFRYSFGIGLQYRFR